MPLSQALPFATTILDVEQTTSSAGTSNEVPRADHRHAVAGAISGTAPTISAPGDVAAVGTAPTIPRRDHLHGREAVASQAEMEAGTEAAVRAVSPLRVAQAIAAQAGAGGIPATTVDAKGDLLAATAADTVTRLAVGTDTHVLTADSAEATGLKWAAAPGAGSGIAETLLDAKGDLIAASAADTAARLAVGTNDFVLSAASGQATGLIWQYPKLTTIEYDIGAAITLTTAGAYYQGPNGTPPAGTYLCEGIMTFHAGGTGNRGFTSRIVTGGSVASGIITGYTGHDDKETDAPSASGNEYQCCTRAIVTLDGSTVISLAGSSATATVDVMRRNPQSNTPLTLNRATILTLLRIA